MFHMEPNFPFSEGIRLSIQEYLRKLDVIKIAHKNFDAYDMVQYRIQNAMYGVEFRAFFDLNVLNDVLALIENPINGIDKPFEQRARHGAALMSFLLPLNINIEPGFAVHENRELAIKKYRLFKRADEIDLQVYVDAFQGKIDRLSQSLIPDIKVNISGLDFSKDINKRSVLKTGVLKIVELELTSLSPFEKIIKYLEWCYADYCFARLPILAACVYFNENKRLSILKDLRSSDRQKALKSVENALWDLLFIRTWQQKIKDAQGSNIYWLLCSRDNAIQEMTKALYLPEDYDDSSRDYYFNFLKSYWTNSEANIIADRIEECQASLNDPSRRCVKEHYSNYFTDISKELESSILAWSPK